MAGGTNSHSSTKYDLGDFLLMLHVEKHDQILEVILTAVRSLILFVQLQTMGGRPLEEAPCL